MTLNFYIEVGARRVCPSPEGLVIGFINREESYILSCASLASEKGCTTSNVLRAVITKNSTDKTRDEHIQLEDLCCSGAQQRRVSCAMECSCRMRK